MSSITGRLIKGSMWLSLSRAIVNGLATLSTFVLAWYLSPADFGLVALATTMLLIVTTVTELSLTQALIRHEAPTESHFSAAWTLNATRGLILCLFFAACAWPASVVYEDPRLFGVMVALGFSVLLGSMTNPRLIMLQRKLIFWQEFVLSVSQKFVGVVVAVAIAMIFHSYWALVVGTLVSQATYLVTSYLVVPFRPRIVFKHMREFFSFSAWLTAGQIVNTLNWRFDHLLIGKVLGNAQLGYYTFGSNLARLPTREATAPLTQTIYPSFATIRDDPGRLAAAYQRVQALVAAIALPAGIGVAVIADPLVRLTLGEKWAPAIFIIQSLASVYALQTLGSLAQPLGMAKGKTRLLFIRDTQMLFVRVPIIFGALMLYGLEGVIYSRVFTGLLGALVNMVLVKHFIGVTVLEQLAANGRALASIAIMAAGVLFASTWLPAANDSVGLAWQLAILVPLGAVLYCGLSFGLWLLMKRPDGPEREILNILGKILSKVRHG
ncbi:lipopolysaccharide biosynthesis protein [Mesorhizobium wenxiniae]|uniref:Lipopolysaccharide biosynthesis protein n=2 Tax=Mesorhizobium TaxID=68287 RepID=A0A271KEJ6_9HYPH|nr:lipopolysaccharide biosynthesis protein [Mesorhizobium wenxiniae]PAP94211.1 lipopolysaccharide biosynthesis protein [Mesorhizobium wenxiniae]